MNTAGLSLGLSNFLRSEHIAIHIPSPHSSAHASPSNSSHSTLNPFECLTIQEHQRRCSRRDSTDTATPPCSPAPTDTFASLYPIAPHLTPQTSPVGSPRSDSPALPDHQYHDHVPTTSLLGKLTIRVVEAKGLAIQGPPRIEKPYVLLQYDRTDSISREYGAEPPVAKKVEGKKGLIKRAPGGGALGLGRTPGATTVVAGEGGRPTLQTKQSSVTVRRVGFSNTSKPDTLPTKGEAPNLKEGTRVVTDEKPAGDAKDIGTPDSPIWNHLCQFDVVSPGRTILICVYDKLAPVGGFPAHGFLGAVSFEPPLTADPGDDGLGLDVWVPLESALDPAVGGEVRLRILFETETHQDRPKLSVDDFAVLKLIGQGSFGQVFRVRKRDTKRIYAMKVITKQSVATRSALAQVLAERQVLARTLDSPFLVGLKFSFQSPTDLFFVIDYKSGGELFSHLQKDGGRFEEDKVRFYLCEIILALQYLHEHNIIYRDLKPENCLLDGSGHCVLVDFGLSKLLKSANDTTKTMCGTTAFMAPEVLMDVGYNYRCDWWSLGVLMFEMCFGWSPFYAESRVEEYERILNSEIRIPSKKGYSPENRDLLLKLLTRDPNDRLGAHGGASEIQSHPFFKTVNWHAVALRRISPPFKPPTAADDDDICDRGRSGDWMFSGDGRCWQTPSTRGSLSCTKDADLDSEGLFRDFTFTAGARAEGENAEAGRNNGRRSSYVTDAP
ncbi:hypothetical protein P7C70_g6494, partial [Phenoliferia sp. Uapishka_3]